MEEHCIWHIGYRQSVSAWEDRWIDSNIRIADFNLNTPPHLQLAKVDDLGSNGVSWKWGELKEWLPMKIIRRISSMLPLFLRQVRMLEHALVKMEIDTQLVSCTNF